jgi:competence CoiA-like predicted nuclease
MSLVIYKDGEPLRPWERKQEIIDDYGNVWKAKMGAMVAHHWALLKGKYPILDYEGMSPWHTEWQNILEKDCGYKLEQIRKDLSGYRKADALHETLEIVVEVQYSSISEDAFYERTKFWVNQGLQIIWVFDIKKHKAKKGKWENQYRWSKQPVWWRAYQDFHSDVHILIQKYKEQAVLLPRYHMEMIPLDEYSLIKSASFKTSWKAWKYFCRTESVTKEELINAFKG